METLWGGWAHTGLTKPQTKMFFPANSQWEELRMVKVWHLTLIQLDTQVQGYVVPHRH